MRIKNQYPHPYSAAHMFLDSKSLCTFWRFLTRRLAIGGSIKTYEQRLLFTSLIKHLGGTMNIGTAGKTSTAALKRVPQYVFSYMVKRVQRP